MQIDAVQIGPFVISKVAFDALMPLIYLFIGGFMTFLATNFSERIKWRKERKEEFIKESRLAMVSAFSMLEEFRKVNRKLDKVLAMLFYENKKLETFPVITSGEFKKIELPKQEFLLLPSEAQQIIQHILRAIYRIDEDIDIYVKYVSAEKFYEWKLKIQEQVDDLERMIRELEELLSFEYKKTYSVD